MKIHGSKFDGVIIDNEIKGVGEGQTIACGERGGHGRRSSATVCMCSHGGGDLNTVMRSRMHMFRRPAVQLAADDFRWRQRVVAGLHFTKYHTHIDCLHAGCAVDASGWSCMCDLDHKLFQQRRPSTLFHISKNTNAQYSPPLAAICMVNVCGRSRNRLYLAVGDSFACLPVATETRVVSILWNAKWRNCNVQSDYEMNQQNYGYSAKFWRNTNIKESNQRMA